MENYNPSEDMELSQKMLDKYHMIGNMKELHEKLRSVPDSYDGFISGILRYASTSQPRKEKIMEYLEQNPQATSSQITKYVIEQPDFHDAAKQTHLESKLYKVSDCYSDFIKAVLNYVSSKIGRVDAILDYINKNTDATTSDILEFISNQDDFYE